MDVRVERDGGPALHRQGQASPHPIPERHPQDHTGA